MLKGTEQMSPFLWNSTSLPASMISPVISWPRMRPAGAVVRPRTMCWSEPQMLVETTLRMAPWSAFFLLVGLMSLGKSMDWILTSPGLMYATPRLEEGMADLRVLYPFVLLEPLTTCDGRTT